MRPDVLNPIFTPARSLTGIGPKTGALMEKLAGPMVRDVLFHLPSGLIDRSSRPGVANAVDGLIQTFEVEIETHMPADNPRRPYRIRARDETGFLTLAWFHARADYLRRLAPEGSRRIVSGRVERFGGEIQILHPDHVVDLKQAADVPAYEAIYPLTQGLSAKVVRKAAADALSKAPDLDEWLSASVLAHYGWPAWRAAIEAAHTPQAEADLSTVSLARSRLAYDELLADQLALALMRQRRRAEPGRARGGDGRLVQRVLNAAPYEPTGAQRRALEEISRDLGAPRRMARLLQGDVGAGKTFVAALAMARAAEAGAQCALMAPTEILARQHLRSLEPLLSAAGLTCAALTGRDKGAGRREILAGLADGSLNVVCGTHALFQDEVMFAALGLIVIDEQHRFGVSDRLRLTAKGDRPDLLVMTATPIPRTLTLASFGDLDVTRLDEKPPGRTPVDTRAVSTARLDDVMQGVGRAIERGDKVYWVCPLVEESDVSDLAAAEERWRELCGQFGKDRVGLLHGRMSAQAKEETADAFKRGDLQVLVATTVVEVGVDAPDATVMIIEHAERFGLAQLHQLRGRVGRGAKASSCLLLYRPPLGETARRRLDIMRATDDGFVIAEEDWKLRGPGEMLGTRQAGIANYRLAQLPAHDALLEMAFDDARLFADTDPQLETPRGAALRTLLYLFDRERAVALLRAG